MNKRRWHDFDDGFDEASLFDEEEYPFERRRKPRRGPRERDDVLRVAKPRRHREAVSKVSRLSS